MGEYSYYHLLSIVSRIQEEILPEFTPGETLPSERQIAERLGETHNRVHRAIQILEKDGIVRSSHCRRGVYLCRYDKAAANTSIPKGKKIKITFWVPEVDPDYQQWQIVCNHFTTINPDLTVELKSQPENKPCDLSLVWQPLLDCDGLYDLTDEDFFRGETEPSIFVPNILDVGKQWGRQYAVPILHAPATYWGHRNMLRRLSLFQDNFNDPLDFFRWGKQLEDSGLCAMGYTFLGFIYHGVQWGITPVRQGDELFFDRELVKHFLTDIKPWIDPSRLTYAPRPHYKLFHRGQIGLHSNYLSSLPITERRFQMLGQPLKPGGRSCQSVFMLAISKDTKEKDVCKEFIRFVLTEHVQKMFMNNYVKFSVRKNLYQKQYAEANKKYGGKIPPFDIKGVNLDLDHFISIGNFLYQTSANYLVDYTGLKQTLDKMCHISIPAIRNQWLQDISDNSRIRYKEYIERIKKGYRSQ